MSEDLITVYLSDKSASLIERIEAISPSLAKDIKRVAANAIDQAGELALAAVRSKIPIDTSELRDKFVGKTSPNFSAYQPRSTVFLLDGTHYGRDKKALGSIDLAHILNIGIGKSGKELRRTQNSAAYAYSGFGYGSEARRSPTADWVGKADRAFRQKLGSFLMSKDFFNG